MPNPALTPEESFGWDAGVEFTFFKGVAILDVTYFRANLTDKINGTAPGPRPGTFTSVNLPGESTREGVEVSARFKLDRNADARRRLHLYRRPRRPTASASSAGRRMRASVPTSPTRSTAGAARRRSPPSTTAARTDIAFPMPFFFPTQRVALDAYWLVNATVVLQAAAGRGGVRAR